MGKGYPSSIEAYFAHTGVVSRPAPLPPGPLHPPGSEQLTKVYVEATTTCNLTCRTCVRNSWDEPLGHMPLPLYRQLIEQLRDGPRPLKLVFAGYGEPMVHPDILTMLSLAKGIGARVEIVTNGTRLEAEVATALVDLAVNKVWFSVDGLTPESYAAIRRGGQLATVRDHVRELYGVRRRARQVLPDIGLVFVAMASNIEELPELYHFAASLRATDVMVTNLLPHTPDMVGEILYERTLAMGRYSGSREVPRVQLPRLDFNARTGGPLLSVLNRAFNLELGGADMASHSNFCPFVRVGATAVRWDGEVSPCTPLLHSHPVSVAGRWQRYKHISFGNIGQQPLTQIWEAEAYAAQRAKVWDFAFAPCVYCDGCELSETNDADCFSNTFPTCGGCLWAQGIVRCP